MCRCKKRKHDKSGLDLMRSGTYVSVDVTKIVKYIAIAGVLIVAIIFGSKGCHEVIKASGETPEE